MKTTQSIVCSVVEHVLSPLGLAWGRQLAIFLVLILGHCVQSGAKAPDIASVSHPRFLFLLLWQRSKEQVGNRRMRSRRRKRMTSEHSSKLGSGTTGRTPIPGAMATDRTWVSLPTTRWEDGDAHTFPQRKAVPSAASALARRHRCFILPCVQ